MNAYAEPVVSLDLDIAVVVEEVDRVEKLMAGRFRVERFPHSINVNEPCSDLRLQIQTDARYIAFVSRAQPPNVLGRTLPVARIADVLAKVKESCAKEGFPFTIADPVWRRLMDGCIAHEFDVFDAANELKKATA